MADADHHGAGGVEPLRLVAQYVVEQLDIGVASGGLVKRVAIQREKAILEDAAFQAHQRKADALGLDREHRQVMGSLVQPQADGPPPGQGGLRRAGLVDQLAVGQLLHQHRNARGAQVHMAHDLGAGFALPTAHQVKYALDVGFLDLLLIAGMDETKLVLGQILHTDPFLNHGADADQRGCPNQQGKQSE